MDKLEKMMELQHSLQARLGTWDKIVDDASKQQFVNQMILAMFEETTEIMRETRYKNPDAVPFGWKKGQEWNNELFKEELIDILHFWMNLVHISGMTVEEVYNRYCRKNNINHERQDKNY
jgi:dimeric dUTPase (all-alpha-NTP-PPase superfamily)